MKSAQSVSQSVFAGGDGVSSYMATLEDLAAKRRGLADVIVALAKVAGVDPAPYLDVPASVTSAVPYVPVFHAPKKEPAPPRPPSPVPSTTNGARANKVEGELPAEILAVLKKHGEPMQPKDLAKAMRKDWSTVAYHVKKLEKAKQVVLSGTTFDRRVALA